MNEIWQIGDIKVTRVVEMEVVGGSRFILPDATRDACLPYSWMQPHFMDDSGNLVMSIHALVIEVGERRIIVDTCIGNDKERSIPNWSNLQTNFLKDMENIGYPVESIDTVLCTHLHVDHVGWNTRLVNGEWVPTFENARYLIGEDEWTYWDTNEDPTSYGNVMDDSVRPVIEAGLVDLVSTSETIAPGIRLESTPGHTPGHVSVLLESRGEEAVITGDCIHHPCQITRTDWCSSADYDKDQGRATREKFLERLVETNVLVIGTHFATPTAGHIRHYPEGGYWLDVS
ncbi:MAG: MBL fold metallo-hydrolase [Pseudomonadales bacterium]|nr:MBL fold metallo-hydrolase [Pseudomonadales bacterium]HAO54283.1 MBL fold metallo-hydrolase [Gammaproteobacteria bacterium]|tara:strand:- start:1274 stop:2134 length:861 start_codon:yes stop_codon:yes gene_type:complete